MIQATDTAGSDTPLLAGRRIILGVSGGIAAYKAPLIVRRLRDAGADVQVVTTRGAEHFVTPTALQAVSGRVVRNDLWDPHAEAAMGHIELARWADLLLIAPATADLMARLAQGRADDLLTTLRLATRAPVLLAPAMNVAMWEHPATQRNLLRLEADGVHVAGPGDGAMACGEFGPGRLLEPEELLQRAIGVLGAAESPLPGLSGRHVVITAGPTREALDPVRYLSNHSSGKQGYALATAARDAGARVTLISGPVALAAPAGVETVRVTSAREMHDAVMARLHDCEVFIGVAAVADFRPEQSAAQKLKKRTDGRALTGGGAMTLTLVENPDIVAAVAASSPRPYVIGFAAETERVLEHGREKRQRKGMDLIAVNDVSDPAIGFNSDDNAVTLIWDGGECRLARSSKAEVARAILRTAAENLARA